MISYPYILAICRSNKGANANIPNATPDVTHTKRLSIAYQHPELFHFITAVGVAGY
jgi:hypothetical protein